jgi:hypothetical protein
MARAAEKRIDVVEDQVEDMQQDDTAQPTEAVQPTDIAAEDTVAEGAADADLVADDVAQQDAVQSDDAPEVVARCCLPPPSRSTSRRSPSACPMA